MLRVNIRRQTTAGQMPKLRQLDFEVISGFSRALACRSRFRMLVEYSRRTSTRSLTRSIFNPRSIWALGHPRTQLSFGNSGRKQSACATGYQTCVSAVCSPPSNPTGRRPAFTSFGLKAAETKAPWRIVSNSGGVVSEWSCRKDHSEEPSTFGVSTRRGCSLTGLVTGKTTESSVVHGARESRVDLASLRGRARAKSALEPGIWQARR
ncbi:hypothetical protein B0T19DRAFT_407492 [Cercophora scortea]|uniref:Uncharacterized protein n=1 Tax=Cercophora scortea TaxID=314031 RepID=A0AAE0J3X8_9PEZI|nr:hypothetical protein B0T19DRAFT_407492 [Cercophora scortea]